MKNQKARRQVHADIMSEWYRSGRSDDYAAIAEACGTTPQSVEHAITTHQTETPSVNGDAGIKAVRALEKKKRREKNSNWLEHLPFLRNRGK